MANHISSKKRIRSSETSKLRNKYQAKTTRNAIRKLKENNDKKEVEVQLPKVLSLIDKLAKNSVIHKNKAGNLKSKLTKHVNSLK